MGGEAQGIEDGHVHATHGIDDVGGNLLAIAQVGQSLSAALGKEKAVCIDLAVRQFKGGNFEIADAERARENPGLRDKVTARPWPIVKGKSENALQHPHGGFAGVNWQWVSASQIADPAAIVHTHDMIRVAMGDDY